MQIGKTMEIGIVSDEIAPDFLQAVEHGTSWGIKRYEIRTLKTGRVPDVDPVEIEEVSRTVRERGLRITALSPGLFKLPADNRPEIVRQLDVMLPRTLELASRLGVKRVIVFGFPRGNVDTASVPDEVLEFLGRAAETGAKAGITILVENEPGFWCDTGRNTAQVLKRVGSAYLKANWDPCNAFGLGEEPFPEGYRYVKDFVANVHVKDTRRGGLVECVPIGEGLIDWKGQLRALQEDGQVDHVTIETHCLPLIEKSKQNAETLRAMLSEHKGNSHR